MIDEFQQNLAMQGATLEMYFQHTGLDHEKLHKELEPEAKNEFYTDWLLMLLFVMLKLK